MKTSELDGPALDWAVAKANGLCVKHAGGTWFYIPMMDQDKIGAGYSPSTQWYRGGPIIEREKISISYMSNAPLWVAMNGTGRIKPNIGGPTPLIAAMRCYVASKLGDEVDIPKELL